MYYMLILTQIFVRFFCIIWEYLKTATKTEGSGRVIGHFFLANSIHGVMNSVFTLLVRRETILLKGKGKVKEGLCKRIGFLTQGICWLYTEVVTPSCHLDYLIYIYIYIYIYIFDIFLDVFGESSPFLF